MIAGPTGVGLPFVLPRAEQPGQLGETTAFIFYTVSLADLAIGWWLRSRAFARARQLPAPSADEVARRLAGPALMAVTLADTPAMFGLVSYVAFGNRGALNVLCVLSLIGLALLRPNPDQWQDIVRGISIDADRRS